MSNPLVKWIELSIVLHPNGRIEVRGPIQDPLLTYGLLELAKDELRRHWAAQEQARQDQARIVVPDTLPPTSLRSS